MVERVSLVGALFLLFEKPFFFSVSKVYDKESLFEPICFVNSLSIYSVFLKISLENLSLSSRSFAFCFS